MQRVLSLQGINKVYKKKITDVGKKQLLFPHLKKLQIENNQV